MNHLFKFRCTVATSSGESFYATAERLTISTLLLNAPRVLPYGSAVTVDLVHLSSVGPVLVPAVVRWRTAGGFGLQLGQLDARAMYLLNRLRTRMRQTA